MLAKGAGLKAGQLVGQLGDCHLYNNHLEQAKEYKDRPRRAMPQLELESGIYLKEFLHIPEANEIKLINYNPYASIKAELSVGK